MVRTCFSFGWRVNRPPKCRFKRLWKRISDLAMLWVTTHSPVNLKAFNVIRNGDQCFWGGRDDALTGFDKNVVPQQ